MGFLSAHYNKVIKWLKKAMLFSMTNDKPEVWHVHFIEHLWLKVAAIAQIPGRQHQNEMALSLLQ
jgi:hypothetical protein